MFPLTPLATNKLINLLTNNNSLAQVVNTGATAAGVNIPSLGSTQVFSSFVPPDMGDKDLQLSYPRVCVYTTQIVNQQKEKFRAFSGTATVFTDLWSSASLEQETELSLHFYVEGVASLLRANIGDWGDGCRYSGIYEAHFDAPKVGGFGFVQSARIVCTLEVGFN